MVECQNTKEFEQYTVGDKVEAKILKITKDEDKGRTWVELTRKKAHMSKTLGLNQDELKQTVKGIDDLVQGQDYDALVVQSSWDSQEPVNLKFSKPVQIQISAFVRGQIPFNQILNMSDLSNLGIQYKKFKIGQKLSVKYIQNGQFSLLDSIFKEKTTYKKGELVTARYVGIVKGRGVTV